ncbi:hypothetical protein I7I53_05800 [Histoplasma capsulatum var. duboisii H88]|uniref:Uncharacterized protein n=1 Tax=Ajellomyces capsulatus (strain H88) TaxID=544711 RepID=A0A8A1LVS5_AJEC8|nr:hypothetical protein I7I53_05800 [Histoplasma capsulatum var. duboisii H88]
MRGAMTVTRVVRPTSTQMTCFKLTVGRAYTMRALGPVSALSSLGFGGGPGRSSQSSYSPSAGGLVAEALLLSVMFLGLGGVGGVGGFGRFALVLAGTIAAGGSDGGAIFPFAGSVPCRP